jgi:hypothetical protein
MVACMAALSTVARGQVIYSDPADTRITDAGTEIDIDLDGLADVQLIAGIACTDDLQFCYNSVNAVSLDDLSVQIITDLSTLLLHADGAASYADGAEIIPDEASAGVAYLASNLAEGTQTQTGTMAPQGTRSIGIVFWKTDGPHMAYVRVRNTNGLIAGFDLLDFAYNGEPYAPIIAGETGLACPADFNADGGIDGSDIEAFYIAFASGEAIADVNYDGGVDGQDVERFFRVWQDGGC